MSRASKIFEMEALTIRIVQQDDLASIVKEITPTPRHNDVVLLCPDAFDDVKIPQEWIIQGIRAYVDDQETRAFFCGKGFVQQEQWLTIPDDVLRGPNATPEKQVQHGEADEYTAEILLQLLFDYISPKAKLLSTAGTRFYFEFSAKPGLELDENNRFYLDKAASSADTQNIVRALSNRNSKVGTADTDQSCANSPISAQHEKALQNTLRRRSFDGQIYRYYTSRFKHTFFSYENKALSAEGAKTDWISQYRLPLEQTQTTTLPELCVHFAEGSKKITAFITDLNLTVLDSTSGLKNGFYQRKQDDHEVINYLLSIECKPSIPDDFNISGWRTLLNGFSNDEKHRQAVLNLQTEYWLRFNFYARIIKPSFIEQFDEGKVGFLTLSGKGQLNIDDVFESTNGIGGKVQSTERAKSDSVETQPADYFTAPDNRVVQELAAQFFKSKNDFEKAFSQFKPDDTRMFTLSHIAYSENYPADSFTEKMSRKIFRFFKYVDYYEMLNYNAEYLGELGKSQDYTRWDNHTSLSSFNEFAATTMGFGKFACEQQNIHWLRQYCYFIEYALIARHFLNSLAERIRLNTEQMLCEAESDDNAKEHFRDLRRDFITFMNSYWFTQVSKEQQAIELFEKCKSALKLESEFHAVKDKIEWADEFVESRRDIALSKNADIIARIALTAAFLSLGINYYALLEYMFGLTLPNSPTGIAATYSWVNFGLNLTIAVIILYAIKPKKLKKKLLIFKKFKK